MNFVYVNKVYEGTKLDDAGNPVNARATGE